jgi:hypothetical protein
MGGRTLAARSGYGLSFELWIVQAGIFLSMLGYGGSCRSRSSTSTTAAASASGRPAWSSAPSPAWPLSPRRSSAR